MEALRKRVRHVVDLLHWVSSGVEGLLWADDPDVLAIVLNLADERNVLQAEDGQVHLLNEVESEGSARLPVEGTLAKDCADDGSSFQMRLDLVQNLSFGVRWRADQNQVGIADDILGLVRGHIDLAFQCSELLPV